jgi:hypothetical protein
VPIVFLAALPATAGTPVATTVVDETVYTTKADYTAPGYGDSKAGHWHNLTGAIVALRLPDGRIAVVNCKPQHYEGVEAGTDEPTPQVCPTPPPNTRVTADFIARRWAKLDWPEHKEQVYRVLGVLDPPAK